MAGSIKGITIEIGGETTGLQKALQDVNKKGRDLQSELKQVERLLKFDPGNAELVAQKQQLLGEQVENTTVKLNRLKEAQSQVEKQFKSGEIGAEQYRAFQREVVQTEGKLKSLKESISKIDDGSTIKGIREDMSKLSRGTQEAKGAVKELGGELTGLAAGLAAGGGIAGSIEKALDTSSLDTNIEISMEVPEESKKSVKDAINTVSSYGVDAEEALEGVRRQWALNKDASDESNAAVIEGAGAIARAYAGIDFTELIQETNEISRELNITNEEALGLTNALLKMGFPPEQLDIISEYGKQLTDAGYNAEEIQAIMAAGVETGTWNIDNLLDGLKEGRIKLAEFGQEVPKATKDLLANTEISTKQFQEWGKAVSEGGTTGREAMQEAAQALLEVEDSTTRNALGVQMFGTMWEDQGTNITDTILNMDNHMMSAKENQDALNQSVEGLNSDPAVKLKQAMSDLIIAAQPVLEAIANIVSKVAEWVSNNPTLTATIAAITTVVGILVGGLMGLAPIISSIIGLAKVLGLSIGAIAAPIGIAIAAIAAIIAIGILLYKNWDTVKAKAIQVWGSIRDFLSKTGVAIKNGLTNAWNTIKSNTSSAFNSVKSTISSVWNSIKSSVSSTVSGMVSTVKSKFQEIVSGVGEKMRAVLSKVKEIWGRVKGFFQGINLFSIGKNIIQGLINGVGSMAGALWSKATSLAKGIGEKIAGALDINSPSRVTMELGEFTGEGLALGLESMTKDIEKASDKMAMSAIPEIPELKNNFGSKLATQTRPAGPLVFQSILNGRVIAEEIYPDMDNLFGNNASMSLYMRGSR